MKLKKGEFIRHDILEGVKWDTVKREEKIKEEITRLIRESLANANLQYKSFLDFKKEYEKEVLPLLNRSQCMSQELLAMINDGDNNVLRNARKSSWQPIHPKIHLKIRPII